MNRPQAWDLLNEYTKNPALIRHALCVEAAMRTYARLGGADEHPWALAGHLNVVMAPAAAKASLFR